MRIRPSEFFDLGITDLVPVIPPGAQLAPSSKIPQVSIGKVPGRRLDNGLWVGLNWRAFVATPDDVTQWERYNANVGLRADRFPGLDIDCLDESLAQIVEDFAFAKLGGAPVRLGRAPKRLLMFQTVEPFGRMRLWVTKDKVEHLVELLGAGNQYVVDGIHPKTLQPYEWNTTPRGLAFITHEQAATFFAELKTVLEMVHGLDVRLDGDGKLRDRAVATDQTSLLAPSIELLQEAVSLIPNGDDKSREDIVKVGHAIRAACGDDIEEGKALYVDLVTRGGHRGEIAEADYNRFRAPYTVGWSLIAEMARPYGFDWTPMEATEDAAAPDDRDVTAYFLSDQWVADRVVAARSADLRFSPESGRWFVWSGSLWEPDATMAAENVIYEELKRLGDVIGRMGSTGPEQAKYAKEARMLCDGSKAAAVRKILQTRREIAVSLSAFDANAFDLCTPGGIVDLTTGALRPADPDALTSKSTSVTPDRSGEPTAWLRFLHEACAGDVELLEYIQRWAGYCLTGSTREQMLAFWLGRGGTGKSTVLNTLVGVLHDYAKVTPLDTFTASKSERHSTDIASLEGARLVVSSETQVGKRWDEARIKSLTGGERVTARLMHRDNHTYKPTFKLLMAGNNAPSIRTADDAMKRRLVFLPFNTKPAVVDRDLNEKLEAEYGKILAWMVDGCLAWQREGLQPPSKVREYTDSYFESEDSIGLFLKARTTPGGDISATQLFGAWREYANAANEHVGSARAFGDALSTRDVGRRRKASGVFYDLTLTVDGFDAV